MTVVERASYDGGTDAARRQNSRIDHFVAAVLMQEIVAAFLLTVAER